MSLETGTGRLLVGSSSTNHSWSHHRSTFGQLPVTLDLVSLLEASGLRGRGGAGFPTFQKVALVQRERARHKCVVVNAMEGEPASHKDQSLLALSPHLVLDGAESVARSIGASEIIVCVPRENQDTVVHVSRAIGQRSGQSRGEIFVLRTPPRRYIAGEESALVHWLDNNETLPQYRPVRPTVLRTKKVTMLVQNAETLAHVGLIVRHGANWYRQAGTAAHPGTTLVSVTGAVERPIVVEVPLGTPIQAILELAHADESPSALLLGGYGGTWLDGRHRGVGFDNESLATFGASVGAGVIVVLPTNGCGITETHRIVQWMAHESARQCGPCAFGLPAMAQSLGALCRGGLGAKGAMQALHARSAHVRGRGACHHPDGVVRLVESALATFADDIACHEGNIPCAAAGQSRIAIVPTIASAQELDWQ